MNWPRNLSAALASTLFVAVIGCVVGLAGCGSNRPAVPLHAATCPGAGRSAAQRLREFSQLGSSHVGPGPLAPGGVRWSTVCDGVGARVIRGGPLDASLNSAAPYRGQICPSVAVSPVLVLLRYESATRRFLVDLGGCPGVVLSNGTKLILADRAVHRVTDLLGRP
jgi:hypothetical protein